MAKVSNSTKLITSRLMGMVVESAAVCMSRIDHFSSR